MQIKKELNNGKIITGKLKFIDSFKFMSSSLSTLVHNLSAWLHDKKRKKCKPCYEYASTEDKKLICKCIGCSKNYELRFNRDLINRFADTYRFCNEAINKFIFLLKKGIYSYEYMDSWIDLMKNHCLIKKIFIVV